MSSLGMEPAAEETRATCDRLDARPIDEASLRSNCIVVANLLFERRDCARPRSGHDITVLLPFALNLVALDHFSHQGVGLGRAGDQSVGPRLAKHIPQYRQAEMGEFRSAMASVSARASEPRLLHLEDGDVDAF